MKKLGKDTDLIMKNVAILGASGYTGAEAVRLIAGHPKLTIKALTGHSRAGQAYGDIYPNFAPLNLPMVIKWEDVDWAGIDVAFACLPHGASQDTIAKIIDKVDTVIDLSADFRLWDPDLYANTYGRSHVHTELLKTAIYGLTELNRTEIKNAKLISCPGCYPTASILALLPAIEKGLISQDDIIIDAKSGVTGAGRKTSAGLIYSEVSDGAHAYSVGVHRHGPEIDQILSHVAKSKIEVSFTPHLIPMNRGMIATCYVSLKKDHTVQDLRSAYIARYEDEPFIHVETEGDVPQTRHIRASNHCRIGIFNDRNAGRAIIISVIDNLTKGSSGQALQNYNVTQGWPETLGLDIAPVFP